MNYEQEPLSSQTALEPGRIQFVPTQCECRANEGVPGIVLAVVLYSTFLAGFILGIIASGFTVHVRP